jgi:hypothetical protein
MELDQTPPHPTSAVGGPDGKPPAPGTGPRPVEVGSRTPVGVLSRTPAADTESSATDIDLAFVAPVPSAAVKMSRGRRWLFVLAVVVMSAALTVAVVAGVHGQARLDRTDASLAATRAQLRQTTERVAYARSLLKELDGQSDAAGQTLESVTAHLAADQAVLAKAEAGAGANALSVSQLTTCLTGVEQSLNLIAAGNQSGAASTLRGVSTACRAAEPSG